jgi:Outer membrane lipoprotein-sorting protein
MRLFFYLLCGLIGFSSNAYANLRGDQLIDQYLTRSARHDAVLSVRVDYQEPKEEPVRLEFTWMRKVKPDVTSHLLRIEAPGSEKGKLLLVHEKADGVTDYFAYRPRSTLKRKVRISGTRNYQYKGLSISVQEIIGGELLKYNHQFNGIETLNGLTCYVVENQLRAEFKNDSNYPRLRIYLREDSGMPLRAELFGKSDQLKMIYFEEVQKIEGIWTITRARIEDPKKQAELIVTLKEAHYNPDLADYWFTEEYLKSPQ